MHVYLLTLFYCHPAASAGLGCASVRCAWLYMRCGLLCTCLSHSTCTVDGGVPVSRALLVLKARCLNHGCLSVSYTHLTLPTKRIV